MASTLKADGVVHALDDWNKRAGRMHQGQSGVANVLKTRMNGRGDY